MAKGGLASIHAESPKAVFGRLKDLGVERALANELKVLVYMGLFHARIKGSLQRFRRVKAIYFVKEVDDNYEPRLSLIARYEPERDKLFIEDPKPLLDLISERSLLSVDELEARWMLRARFLSLMLNPKLREKYSDPQEWLEALTAFYRDPDRTIRGLEAIAGVKEEPKAQEMLP